MLETSLFRAPQDNTTASEITHMAKKIAEIKPQEVVVMHHTGSVTGKAAQSGDEDPARQDRRDPRGATAFVHPEDHEVIHP